MVVVVAGAVEMELRHRSGVLVIADEALMSLAIVSQRLLSQMTQFYANSIDVC